MGLREDIHNQRAEIEEIAHRHGVSNIRLFGSVLRGEERSDSDIDLLVDIASEGGFTAYLALAEELERLLGRRVDLVTERGLSKHFRPYIEAEARAL